ncbi:hypothetical protein Bbelb_236360 [Branchiostoma belcheri]|nr:hypothetical protein Bbelb_236360 [Branchiostoma belcheri]
MGVYSSVVCGVQRLMAERRTLIMMWSFCLLLFLPVNTAIITGVCKADVDCRSHVGFGTCCAPWFGGFPVSVCKPRGKPGDPCSLLEGVMEDFSPEPNGSSRVFWLCPCHRDLRCLPSSSNQLLGKCG